MCVCVGDVDGASYEPHEEQREDDRGNKSSSCSRTELGSFSGSSAGHCIAGIDIVCPSELHLSGWMLSVCFSVAKFSSIY